MSATEAETGLGEWFAHPSLVRLLDKFRGFVSYVEDTARKHQAVNKGHGHLLVDTLAPVTQCGGEHVLCVSCSSVRALQHRGRKEPHAGQSDTARPSTAVPMPEIRVAKTKNGPLEVLDPNTSDELDGSDLPSEYAVLDLTVSRSAQVSCANCRACGGGCEAPRSCNLAVALMDGLLENRKDDLLCFSQFAGGQPRHIATASTSVGHFPRALERHWLTPALFHPHRRRRRRRRRRRHRHRLKSKVRASMRCKQLASQ